MWRLISFVISLIKSVNNDLEEDNLPTKADLLASANVRDAVDTAEVKRHSSSQR